MAKKKQKQKKTTNSTKRVKIKIIGIGGGGGNIVKELSKKLDFSSTRLDFCAVNTDMQALHVLPDNLKKLSLGKEETKGLGTGRDVNLGKKIAEKEEEKIKSLFSDEKDLYILISSLGGGTGTGFVPVFSKIAKEKNATTLGIFTLPFNFEGKDRIKDSEKAIMSAETDLNAVLVIPNEKIFKLVDESIPFTDALNVINDQLAKSLQGLLNTIYLSSLINIDWADIKRTISNGNKRAYLNTKQGKIKEDLDNFAKELLNNELVSYNFKDSENVLFNIEGGKNLSMQELSLISEKIHELAEDAEIIFGLTKNLKLKDEVRATVLATGKQKEEKPKKKKKKTKPTVKRRSGVEIKKAKEEEIKKEEDDEKFFDVPAFLRKKK